MRGSPLFNTVLVVLGLALAAAGLAGLTGGRAAAPGAAAMVDGAGDAAVEADSVCPARLKFAHVPESVSVSHLGRELWGASGAGTAEFGFDLRLPATLAADGVDLLLSVRWPAGTPESVAELTLEPPSLDSRTRSAWGEGSLDEVLAFTWTGDAP
jgi:hypothetical protein